MQIQDDERQITQLFEDGDRALMSGNARELARIFADDYVQYDESGRCFTRKDVLDNLQSGAVRFLAMVSTGRLIRMLSREIAVVHGSEVDEIEQAGKRASVRYIYTDVVVKRQGSWQIVASQLARPAV
jgi:uncharacterized protein (TIGR02246 family)